MQSSESSLHMPVRWGVLSAANIGAKRVAPAIHASSNGRLLAVGSRNPERVQELFAFAPDVLIYGDYDSVINDPEIEAIYIPLPNRFHPQTLWALEQVAEGRIGKVKLVRASFSFNVGSRPHDIRLQAALAGGSLMDVGCYPVNLCRAVYGHTPLAVGARVHTPADGEVERYASAVLDFDDGCFGLIDSSLELPTRQVGEIIGEGGTITIPLPFTPGHIETVVIVALEDQAIHQRFSPVDQYRLEVEHFASCIRHGHQSYLSLDETIENLATIEAIYQSAGYMWPIM